MRLPGFREVSDLGLGWSRKVGMWQGGKQGNKEDSPERHEDTKGKAEKKEILDAFVENFEPGRPNQKAENPSSLSSSLFFVSSW